MSIKLSTLQKVVKAIILSTISKTLPGHIKNNIASSHSDHNCLTSPSHLTLSL